MHECRAPPGSYAARVSAFGGLNKSRVRARIHGRLKNCHVAHMHAPLTNKLTIDDKTCFTTRRSKMVRLPRGGCPADMCQPEFRVITGNAVALSPLLPVLHSGVWSML